MTDPPFPLDARGPADRAERAHRLDRVLVELSLSDAVTSGDLAEALRAICAAAARALAVDRTSVWLFDEAHRHLRSAVIFASGTYSFLPAAEIAADANPPYFAALEQQRVIAAHDVHADERTERFAAVYFRPLGISSTLDAPIRLRGRLLGAVCHEHVGAARTWTLEEERFVASVGDLVALALAADERACAQLALRESEARYRLLVDGARDVIFNLDTTGTITSLNPALRTILGLEPSEWVGRHFTAVVYRDDVDEGVELFSRAVRGESLPNFELRLRNAAGEPVWFEFMVSVQGAGDAVSSVFGVGRDVTARKRSEQRRRVLGEVERALAAAGSDLEPALAAVHRSVAQALPCTHVATALLEPGSGAVRVVAQDAGPAASEGATDRAAHELVRRTIARGETSVLDTRVPAAHGPTTIPRATVATPLRSPDGVIGALVASRDGAQQLDAEQVHLCESVARELAIALTAARRRAAEHESAEVATALARVGQELIASVDLPLLLDGLCRVTTEVLRCDVSHTFLRDEEEGASELVASHGHAPQHAEVLRTLPISDVHTQGLVDVLRREHVVVSRAGEGLVADHLWDVYGTGSALLIGLFQGSRILGAQSAAFLRGRGDFGPRDLRIARGIAQLASLAIANARLVAELEAASRVKSDFVATMSHELRTPLNVILGYGDLLLLEDLGPLTNDQRDALDRMRASALELLELIEATLDLSRLEAGKAAVHLEDVELEAWLREVEGETASLRARKPELRVAWHAPPAGTRAHTDHVKLKVILKNLFANAMKFTDRGAIDVRVAVTRQVLEIVVQDTGIGMTPVVRAVIFDAFRQGDASMTRQHGGVGLGLYITARLVEALRGRIDVESAPGRGSTFRVRVPADPRLGRRAGAGLRERRSAVTPLHEGRG